MASISPTAKDTNHKNTKQNGKENHDANANEPAQLGLVPDNPIISNATQRTFESQENGAKTNQPLKQAIKILTLQRKVAMQVRRTRRIQFKGC